jgi:hypothetical protein
MLSGGTDSVLFVMPPGGLISYFSEHLGTAFLQTLLGRAGIRSRQYLPARNGSLSTFARFLKDERPRVVGLTAYETNLAACRTIARIVRETLPETVLAVGGPNATFTPEETLELLPVDLCLRGAGEGKIVAMVGAILGADRPRQRLGELLGTIPNLVLRTGDGVLRTRPGNLSSFPGEYFRCLDDIPSPYQEGTIETADVGFLTARGCDQHCTYCSFAAISGHRVQYHGVERVLDDLAAFKAIFKRVERHRPSISIFDDAFTLAPQRARTICEGIIARGLQLPFECQTRGDRVDEDLLRLMKRAGFVGISFGLESAVPRVLRAMGKVQNPATADDPGLEAERTFLERLREAVAVAKALGLAPTVSVIGGLPGETAEDFRETLAFVESLGVFMYSHNILSILPGTPLHRVRRRHGLDAGRSPVTWWWWTSHAYDVHSVRPIRNSIVHARRWDEANEIADVLCGRDRPGRAAAEAPWSVVIHADEPHAGTAEWLARILAVQGTIVAVSTRPWDESARARWISAFDEAMVPYGLLALLSREPAPDGAVVLRSLGSFGSHRFELRTAWSPEADRIEADEMGHCRVPVWIASKPAAAPPKRRAALGAPIPQIADGCRWWSGWRRCRRPRVLHVAADLTVRPCWHGPAIGTVGEAFGDLVARAGALGRAGKRAKPAADRCPLAGPAEGARGAAAMRHHEIAAQVAWLLDHREADQQ